MSDQDEPVGPDSFPGEDFPSEPDDRTLSFALGEPAPEPNPGVEKPTPPAPPPEPVKPAPRYHQRPKVARWGCTACDKTWSGQPPSTQHQHTEKNALGKVRFTRHAIKRLP